MKTKGILSFFVLFMAALLMASPASAKTIDYVASAISPAGSFSGASGNFVLNDPVLGGSLINFNLTFSIGTAGATTTFPNQVTFSVVNITKPSTAADPVVKFGVSGSLTDTYTGIFYNYLSTLTTAVSITAPVTPGAYTVKIRASAISAGGLNQGGGVTVSFTVANPCAPVDTNLSLTLTPMCVVFGDTSDVSFSATLTTPGTTPVPVSGKTIGFTVDGISVGTATTNSYGVATLTYNPSGLDVGDHTVGASFQTQECVFNGSANTETLGVKYDFLGFQPPVQIEGGGVGLFSGRVIPVKIKIADAFGNSVPDAEAHVFFRMTTANVAYEEGEPLANTNADSGNLMRYDPTGMQYIFNWDISRVDNGDYNIRIGLGEGLCADDHVATISIKQKSGKK